MPTYLKLSLAAVLATAVAAGFAAVGIGQTSKSGLTHPTQPIAKSASTCRRCRKPRRGMPWEYRLQGLPKVGASSRIYDVDGVSTPASFVRRVHRANGYAICYVNAGAWENWRPDKSRYPADVLGNENGWPGERFVDIRRSDVLLPILRDRFEACKRKGFDAVEPDNVDAYLNDSGFTLTAADQIAFNEAVAQLAHELKLAVGLKNDLEQAGSLASSFDFAVVEECVQYRECSSTRPFRVKRKAVLDVEYKGSFGDLCDEARRHRFSGLMQTLDLDRPGRQCPRRR